MSTNLPNPIDADNPCTSKQFGDAGEHLVVANLILAGVPAIKMPDCWPGFDVMAAPPGQPSVKISVKARHTGTPSGNVKVTMGEFDWLAIVMVADNKPRIWLMPRDVFIAASGPMADLPVRRLSYRALFGELAAYEDNLTLNPAPAAEEAGAS
jgi:hypothetical protein